jgi:DNA-binding response OmpR family regulator
MSRKLPRILLADPQPTGRQSLRRQLNNAGFAVTTAASGGDIILMCDIDPPDILITDIDLPDMDGFEVCEHVRHQAHGADITVIMLAEPTDDMTRAYIGQMVDFAGGDYFFVRPFDDKLLIHLLDNLCEDVEDNYVCIASAPTFPTRAVWPTTRSYSILA